MICYVAATSNMLVGYLAGKHEKKIGFMVSPATRWIKAHPFIPYSIDNGIYADTIASREWSFQSFLALLCKAKESKVKPEFIVVPDVLYDAEKTKKQFHYYSKIIRDLGFDFRLAMAVQDGMSPQDIPSKKVVAFIGGSTRFKQEKTHTFVEAGFDVHVGRVNTLKRLLWASQLGCVSVDGSGWFRCGGTEDQNQRPARIDGLLDFLKWQDDPAYQTNLFGEQVPLLRK
jgi:hypothetical protein